MAEQNVKQTINESERKKAEDRIVRILSKDIEGKYTLYHGLTKVKGISWTLSNAICKTLGMDKRKKIGSLTEQEIKKITEFMKHPELPKQVVNRRADPETGNDKHLIGSDLELRHEFDIKKLKKIKSYRGLRHSVGLPTRGQRTRSNFRRNRKKGAGIKKKKKKT